MKVPLPSSSGAPKATVVHISPALHMSGLKSSTVAVPPSSFMRTFSIVRNAPAVSSLVMVQVLLSPALRVTPEKAKILLTPQSPEKNFV